MSQKMFLVETDDDRLTHFTIRKLRTILQKHGNAWPTLSMFNIVQT